MKMKKILSILLVMIWMSIVFLFSHQQGEGSSSTSKRIANMIAQIVGIHEEEMIEKMEPWVRKGAHYGIYTIGGIVTANCVYQFCKKELKIIVMGTMICSGYAITDEAHQLMVVGRSGNIKDVFIDSLGGLTGIVFFLLILKLVVTWTSKKKKDKGGEARDC